MKNIAIIEDEHYWVEQLKDILYEWSSHHEQIDVSVFLTGEDFLHEYRRVNVKYDIIFLDIKLKGMDGLETARTLRENGYDNVLVIISNHQNMEYIQQGFDVSALQYYAKPVTYENIETLMVRTEKHKSFIYAYAGENIAVPYKEILYFESSRNYILIHCLTQDISPTPFRNSIAHLSTTLPRIFVQCHRSFVVNILHVTKFKNTKIFLRNNMELPMGKSYIQDVASAFRNYK